MLNALKKLTNSVLKPASRRRKQQRGSEAPAEVLEDRTLLAGNVIASMNARGDLILKGDNLGNAVRVRQTAEGIVVEGNTHDGGLTQINGRSREVFNPVVMRHLKANMKGGNDEVYVNASFTGNVTAKMGSGRDGFGLDNEFDPKVVSGNVKINLGSGGTSEAWGSASLENLTVGGNVTIKGGSGAQVAALSDVVVNKKLNVNLGKGADILIMTGVESDSYRLNGGGGLDVFWADAPGEWDEATGFESTICGPI